MRNAPCALNDWLMVAISNMALGVFSLYALDVTVSIVQVHVVDRADTHRVSITTSVSVIR